VIPSTLTERHNKSFNKFKKTSMNEKYFTYIYELNFLHSHFKIQPILCHVNMHSSLKCRPAMIWHIKESAIIWHKEFFSAIVYLLYQAVNQNVFYLCL